MFDVMVVACAECRHLRRMPILASLRGTCSARDSVSKHFVVILLDIYGLLWYRWWWWLLMAAILYIFAIINSVMMMQK